MGIKKGLRYDFSVLYRQQTANVHKGEINIMATATDAKAKLNKWFEGSGELDVDMLSLFPGGCIVEGRDLSTRYQWKKTIGPVADRKQIISRWNNEITGRHAPDYFQTFGLGFF